MGIAILLGLVGFLALIRTIVDGAQWQHIRQASLPADFAHLGEAHRQKMITYARARLRLAFISRWVHFAALVYFFSWNIFSAYFVALANLGLPTLVSGLVFFAGLGLASTLLDLPFAYYSQFRIEAAFAFNRSTRATFWADRAKGLLLGALLGAPLLAAVLLFMQKFPTWGWLYAWVAFAIFQLLLFWLAPTWLMPLFNKFSPLADGELKTKVLALGAQLQFPLADVFVMDGSKRSSKANAFFTGFGRRRRIVLFDTLIDKHSVSELIAVLAHEIGHYRLGHIPQMLFWSLLSAGLIFFGAGWFCGAWGQSYFSLAGSYPIYLGLFFYFLALEPLLFITGLVSQYFSRKNEYAADRYAKAAVGSEQDLCNALKKLSSDSLAVLDPHPWKVALEYSHPPIVARLRALRAAGLK